MSTNAIYLLAGIFGGFFPCIFDILQRQKLPLQQKIELNMEFWLVKAFVLPLSALAMTALCISSSSITGWFSALYLGATFPALLEKLMSINTKDVQLPPGA